MSRPRAISAIVIITRRPRCAESFSTARIGNQRRTSGPNFSKTVTFLRFCLRWLAQRLSVSIAHAYCLRLNQRAAVIIMNTRKEPVYAISNFTMMVMTRILIPRLDLQEKKAGQSALHAAVRSKRIGVVEAILNNHKGDLIGWTFGVNCADNDGNTPLHIASGTISSEYHH